MHRLLRVVLLAASLPCCLGYCRSLGWNPSFNGPPLVEQLTLTSVRVSWAGKLEQAECADNIIVKHYKGINSNDYHLSEPLPTEVTSYVVLDLTPNIEYTYQVKLSPLNLVLWQFSSNHTKRDVTYIFKLTLMVFIE